MSNKVTTPYPLFADIDGSPLNAGFLFLGISGQDAEQYPIVAYWDEAKTLIAAQPISTRNGFIVQEDQPAKIYIEEESCSITIKNRNNTVVHKVTTYDQLSTAKGVNALVSAEQTRAEGAEETLDTKIDNAQLSLGGLIANETSRAIGVETSLQNQIGSIVVGNKAYKTYALMDADKANIPVNSKVSVTSDPDPTKNIDWQWDGTTFTAAPTNVLTQAKQYTDTKVDALIKDTDISVPTVPLVDVDGWFYGAFYEDGSLETPLFKLGMYYDNGFLVVDEDGWILLEQSTSTNVSKDWSQKKLLIFGDSITETSNVEAGIYNSLAYRQNWFLYAYAMLEVKDFNNMARSGASYREYAGQLDWQKISHQVSVAISTGFTPDIVVIACGTNDGIDNLGDYDTAMGKNIADLNMALTAEALRKNLYTISQAYPNAKLFSCLPLQRADAETSTRQPLLDLIRKMSGRYGFTVIDCHNESGIVKDFEVWGASGRDTSDGLHPNPSGQVKEGKLIAAKIKSNYQLQV